MGETRSRAEVLTRTDTPEAWDAGLHAECDAGPIDVGLSVEPKALAVILEAPGVGLLKLAFDVATDGTTTLARASRTLSDGRNGALVAIDVKQVLHLEGELARARAHFEQKVGILTTERDEARDRAAILSDGREQLHQTLEAKLQELSSLKVLVQSERDGRLLCLGERERARAELERVKEELDAGSATLLRELTEARATQALAEEARSKLSAECGELTARFEDVLSARKDDAARAEALNVELAALRAALDAERSARAEAEAKAAKLEEAQASVANLETAMNEAQARYTQTESQISAERNEARARAAALDDQVRDEERARELSLSTERAERSRLEVELAAARTALDQAKAHTETLEAQRSADAASSAQQTAKFHQAITSLEATTARLEAELARAQASAAEAIASNAEMGQATAARLESELAVAQADLETAQARLEESQAEGAARLARVGQLEALMAAADGEAAATQEAREVALKLKTQSERLLAERDEARALARSLHQKSAASKAVDRELLDARTALDHERQLAASLVSERDQLNLRLEALGRMLDQERDARAKALGERDEWLSRFKSLAKGTTESGPVDIAQETRSYSFDKVTVPEIPAVKPVIRPVDKPTEPLLIKKPKKEP
jgi:chromosome segregation ATPase